MDPPRDLEWGELGFKYTRTSFLVFVKWTTETKAWSEPYVRPYAPLELEPSAGALNYGQAFFEGMKAFRREDGSVHIFRGDLHAARAVRSAERICIPPIPPSTFLAAVKAAVAHNSSFVPPFRQGSMYLRPLVLATGADLGVRPSSEYTMVVYSTPVGPYFGASPGINLLVSKRFHRSYPKGVGAAKLPGNYAPCSLPKRQAREKGFHDNLFLDGESDTFVEECAGSNFFALIDGTLYTPSLKKGTLLNGVTRDSMCFIAKTYFHMKVVDDEDLLLERVFQADQAFCSGTAVIVASVASITVEDEPEKAVVFTSVELGQKMKQRLLDIQTGKCKAPEGWLFDVTAADKIPEQN